MLSKDYDVVILGGGTGGYVAAIRASQLGLKTAIVERDKLGGTCLHNGCIPTKSYLRSAEVFTLAKNAADYGIEVGTATVNFEKVFARKNEIVGKLYQGVQGLMKKGKIDVYKKLAEEYDEVMVHPDDVLNYDLLEKIEDKERHILLVNEYCIRNCPLRAFHYLSLIHI